MNDKFLWGVATSANQCEGAYDEAGKGLNTADVMTAGSREKKRLITYCDADGKRGESFVLQGIPQNAEPSIYEDVYYPSHNAIDHYHRFKEDIKLLGEMHCRAYRMSIAWTRIYPNGEETEPNAAGLKFYDEVLAELEKYGIEPIVTISFFETPLALQKYGSWKSRKLVDLYVKYAETLFKYYKGRIRYWQTFNEINAMSAQPWVAGGVSLENETDRNVAAYHQFLASAKAVKVGHGIDPENKIGMMYASHFTYPASPDPKDVLRTMEFMQKWNFYPDVMCNGCYPGYKVKEMEREGIVLPVEEGDAQILREGTVDYISMSYYATHVVGKNTPGIARGLNGINTGYDNPYLEKNTWGWGIDPEGLRYGLNYMYERYRKPLMIVENGLGEVDEPDADFAVHDKYRIEYLSKHIEQLKKAIEHDGVEVWAYTIWSAFDLISLSTGEMKKRYGLIYVDVDDEGKGSFTRKPKDSYYWYRKVIDSNGEDLSTEGYGVEREKENEAADTNG